MIIKSKRRPQTSSDQVIVALRQASVTAADLPNSVLQYVLRTKEVVLLHDASGQNQFAADEYIREHHARSVLCLPLLKQNRLLGVLYLENSLTPHAFTPARMAVLKLLASEAAISMENTRLYSDLEDREARIRRLVDANILGIVTWNVDGAILASNEAFLRMVQYDHEDVAAGRVRWPDMTPADWREQRCTRFGRSNPDRDGSTLRVRVFPERWHSGARADWSHLVPGRRERRRRLRPRFEQTETG